MAKKALVNKANKKPKFAVRGYTRCQRCGRPHAVFRKFGLCRICLREMAHRGELPGFTRAPGDVNGGRSAWASAHRHVPEASRFATGPISETKFAVGPRPGSPVLHGNRTRERCTGQTMTMTDPIADFLTRLRNANTAYHDEVKLPHSKIKANIAEILKREGYISDFRTEDAEVGKTLIVDLKYGPSRERSLAGVRRVSKPGLRVYAKSTNLPKVLGGLGVAIISTSSGLLTDRQAAKQGVGGEVLAYVW